MARRSTTAVVLSHLEFDLLWEDLGEGDPPYPLEVPSHGRTEDERDDLGAEVLRTLTGAGLADGDDVSPELEDLFGLLAHGSPSIDALVFRPTPWRVLATARGSRAVLAVLNDSEVALEPVTDIVAAVTRVVGDAAPGPGDPVSLPRPAFSAAMHAYATGGHAALERALAQAGVTGRATRAITTLVDSPRVATGQLAATGRAGRSAVLSWTDTAAGRYATTTERSGAEQWVRVTPTDTAGFARHVAALLSAVTRPTRES
ncbi:ESX secretion-associated protein EspG [Saccharothrix longispora]|uniref:ESX secretion-associated protein EspG n=1 Tax=Saccharothrix longispora TaxID=33920 RepID=UPI0028FD403C|nr:ESX secretion-associated protein EspG [Saccharothrix longispora]MBY8848904.1 ESX secretion-associated protein EspG [Saccharothrix sp. MB29]MDU0288087.1 ESX secretion-associated protein EspG [Saccharothrix longispora]